MNAITGKLEGDVVVFKVFPTIFFSSTDYAVTFFSQKVIVIYFCFARNVSFQFLTLGFLSHTIKMLNKTHFLVQGKAAKIKKKLA